MKIKLKTFGASLNTRSFANTIFTDIKDNEIIVDFDGIDSVTPSFCHEMFSILLKNKDVKVGIINANESIKAQISKALYTAAN